MFIKECDPLKIKSITGAIFRENYELQVNREMKCPTKFLKIFKIETCSACMEPFIVLLLFC